MECKICRKEGSVFSCEVVEEGRKSFTILLCQDCIDFLHASQEAMARRKANGGRPPNTKEREG